MADERRSLIEARKNKGLTQDQVAARTGISRTYYVHIEKNRRDPALTVALRIADVIGLPVEVLFSDLGVAKRNNSSVHSSSQATKTA